MLCGASESEPLLLLADHALDSKADSELAGVKVIPSKLGPRTIDLNKNKTNKCTADTGRCIFNIRNRSSQSRLIIK